MTSVKTVTYAILLIGLYYFLYYLISGILNPIPGLGDSYDYHIPIQQSILNGSFLHPTHFRLGQWYYPGSAEAINALFILFHFPLTLSNYVATVLLCIACWKLGMTFRLEKYYAVSFAIIFTTLTVVLRWMNAVSIDMWVAVFYCLLLVLLEDPQKTSKYFLTLGFVAGMLVGSKYTTWLFLLPLVLLYGKRILAIISPLRLFLFFIPFSVFGLFWYVRNYIAIHNPFYPLSLLGFKGINIFGENATVVQIGLGNISDMFNAAFGEYKLWLLSLPVAICILFYTFLIKRNYSLDTVNKLFLLGVVNFLFFLSFPTANKPEIMVSSFRYSYPVFIPLILGVFIWASSYKKEEYLLYFAVANMISVISMTYYPKLVLLLIPLFFLSVYTLEKYDVKGKNKAVQMKK